MLTYRAASTVRESVKQSWKLQGKYDWETEVVVMAVMAVDKTIAMDVIIASTNVQRRICSSTA